MSKPLEKMTDKQVAAFHEKMTKLMTSVKMLLVKAPSTDGRRLETAFSEGLEGIQRAWMITLDEQHNREIAAIKKNKSGLKESESLGDVIRRLMESSGKAQSEG